ncbi:hypothetical protein [Flavobacterium sp.]|uniref:hypothetical protein n=1 Tax=Flavobacterium sp. TaxID=239 RepID=UPI000EC01F5D|nr:hypothetical protein [Flavobacterium sp.]HCQ13554.1 hypothetical protein [Flavobacterium sp.]
MKLIIKNKVFSGALQFTIFIGVVIALVLAGLVLLQNTHNFFIEQSKATVENIQLATSGINYLLKEENQTSDTITLKDLSQENQMIQVHLSHWGIFEKAIVKTTHRKKIFYKCALLGTQMESSMRPTLYLQDTYKPLVIVGKTILKGTVFLPNQGINPGYIAGESFYGQELIQGVTKSSGLFLPKLRNTFAEQLKLYFLNNKFNQEEFIGENDLVEAPNSFLKQTKVFYKSGMIELNNNRLSGNIIIKSDELIRIKKTSQLKDVLIIAPIVEVEDGVKGNFQVIASKKITIGKNCKLNYPSALVLIEDEEKQLFSNSQPEDYHIAIDKNSEIKGTLCYFKSVKENDFKTQLFLDENSSVKGEVYCQGNFELKGKVVGSVYTNQFVVNAAGSIFINHIFNGQIVDDNFPESFCGILFEDSKKGIAKWMY